MTAKSTRSGKGVEEVKPAEPQHQTATKYLSKGLTHSRTDKLVVMPRGAGARASGQGAPVEGRMALKTEGHFSPAQALDQLPWNKAQKAHEAKAVVAERRAEATARGYEGEARPECMNFTRVRNGTCMKCDTCGSTTACS